MRKHRVTFYSPGTLFAEQSSREIASWDPKEAARMAATIVERHEARPYGFRFATVIAAPPVKDEEGGELEVIPREVERSGMYFLNGKVRAREEVLEGTDPGENILRSNVRCNGWPAIVEGHSPYRWTQPLEAGDCVVKGDGEIIYRQE